MVAIINARVSNPQGQGGNLILGPVAGDYVVQDGTQFWHLDPEAGVSAADFDHATGYTVRWTAVGANNQSVEQMVGFQGVSLAGIFRFTQNP